jgi:hypothetical protein
VDVERARAILGVTAETPFEDVRRAYLRLVRQHKPEVDPQGFTEIRSAFELLRAAAEGGPEAAPPDGAAEPAAPGGEGQPVPFAIALRQLQATPPMATIARASIIERAAAAAPTDPRIVWLAVEELAPFPLVFARLVALLRAAADRGVPGALEHLSFYAPRRVTAEETDKLLASPATGERLLGARMLIETGRGGAAADVVEQVVQPEALGTRPLPAGALIDLALHCLQKGDPEAARRIDAVMRAHFERFQDEAAVLTPALAVLRGICQEVMTLAAQFPVSAIIAVARLLRGAADAEHPIEVARTLLTLPNQPQDKAMVRFLLERAPMLSQAINMNLAVKNYGRDAMRVPGWQVLLGMVCMFALCIGRAECDDVVRRRNSYGYEVPSAPPPVQSETLLEMRARERCETRNDPRSAIDCIKMRDIASRLSGRHCDRGLLMLPLELGQSEAMQSFLRQASTQARENCADLELGAPVGAGAGAGLSGGTAP